MSIQERTITESTGKELIASIGQLNTSMAVANEQLHTISIKFDRQEQLNDDIEKRMKEREVEAVKISGKVESVKSASDLVAAEHNGRIMAIESWKKSLNGFLIAIGTTLGAAAALGIAYLVFGAKP